MGREARAGQEGIVHMVEGLALGQRKVEKESNLIVAKKAGYITSLQPDEAWINRAVRKHWGIEPDASPLVLFGHRGSSVGRIARGPSLCENGGACPSFPK